MMKPAPHQITQLLRAWSDGDRTALEQLTPLVHAELHRLASRYLSQESPGHALSTTDLVNEAYVRLIDWKSASFANRAHFFGVSARLMRQILVDYARKNRRRAQTQPLSLSEGLLVSRNPRTDLVALDDALNTLEGFDARKSRIVELRFFGGLTVEETAEVLGVSPVTISREWKKAKVWLLHEVSGETRDEA